MDNQFGNCAQQQAPAEPIMLQIPDRAQFEQFAKEQEEAQARVGAQPEVQRAQPAQEEKKEGNLFSRLFRTRIKVAKGKTPIMNVSALFLIIASLSAIWLVAGGAIAALLLGYTFSMEKDSPDFGGDFKKMVKDAGQNMQNAVDSLK